LKEVRSKEESETLFIQNTQGNPKIVLIMPITRNDTNSKSQWASAISFVEKSEIEFLIIVDKTIDNSATEFFMDKFNASNRNLYILPRSISESHYESLGSIQLGENMWVMQLHDDDYWEGHIVLPNLIEAKGVYYSQFYIKNRTGEYLEEKDFLTSARINFVLLPACIWNQFALLVQNQKFHVAGSLDSTLNQMAHLVCKFLPIPGFSYYYDNHNWAGPIVSKRSLKKLTESDGWGTWATTDIALLGRLLDNLSSLSYVQEFAEAEAITQTYMKLMRQFKPRLRRRMLIRLEIFTLQAFSSICRPLLQSFKAAHWERKLISKLARAKFVRDSWSIKQLTEVIELVRILQNEAQFGKLQNRFHFWHVTLLGLTDIIGA